MVCFGQDFGLFLQVRQWFKSTRTILALVPEQIQKGVSWLGNLRSVQYKYAGSRFIFNLPQLGVFLRKFVVNPGPGSVGSRRVNRKSRTSPGSRRERFQSSYDWPMKRNKGHVSRASGPCRHHHHRLIGPQRTPKREHVWQRLGPYSIITNKSTPHITPSRVWSPLPPVASCLWTERQP